MKPDRPNVVRTAATVSVVTLCRSCKPRDGARTTVSKTRRRTIRGTAVRRWSSSALPRQAVSASADSAALVYLVAGVGRPRVAEEESGRVPRGHRRLPASRAAESAAAGEGQRALVRCSSHCQRSRARPHACRRESYGCSSRGLCCSSVLEYLGSLRLLALHPRRLHRPAYTPRYPSPSEWDRTRPPG